MKRSSEGSRAKMAAAIDRFAAEHAEALKLAAAAGMSVDAPPFDT